jgi:hypothetical protein
MALGQIRVRQEMTPEGDQVSVSLFHNRLCRVGFESARRDDFPFEDLAQLRRHNRFLTLGDEHVALDSWFKSMPGSHLLQSTTYKNTGQSLYEFCTDASKPVRPTH